MKKLITFSLWGIDPKYTIGAIKNAELLSVIYPDWYARFYCGTSVPSDIIIKLKSFKNVEIVIMSEEGDWNGMFWRFYPASEKDIDVMISRDTDSRINVREKESIDEWLNSDKDFHIMRDHPWHGTQILGGMWGVRNGLLENMKNMIDDYSKGNFWQVDQNFLKEKIYPIIKNYSFVHDEFFNYENWKRKFPQKRNGQQFVGESFSFDDVPNSQHRSMIK